VNKMSRIEIIYTEFDKNDKKVGVIKKHSFEDFQIKSLSIETSLDEYEQIIKIDVRKKTMTKREEKEILEIMKKDMGMDF